MSKFRKWLILKLLKEYKLFDPFREIWSMIDEENQKENPDCANVEAWLLIIERFKDKDMFCLTHDGGESNAELLHGKDSY